MVDTDHDGLSDAVELDLGTRPTDPDTDNDGLLDGWEHAGYVSAGGIEPLPAYGADPTVKDIFVELDWMLSQGPASNLNAIVAYQAAVDVTRVFESSGRGIRIHFDLGPRIEQEIPRELLEDIDFSAFKEEPDVLKALPQQDSFSARPRSVCDGASTAISLYDAFSGGRWFRPSRRHLFYYVVFADQAAPLSNDQDPNAGRRHPYSESFADSLARRDGLRGQGIRASVIFRKPAADLAPELLRYYYSATLLHELGHAFGLGHGGSKPDRNWDNINWKPNYPSVMNSRFLGCGIDIVGNLPVMGFSHGALTIELHEDSLVEAVGMGRLPNDHVLTCVGVPRLDITALPNNLDWNQDGQLAGGYVAVDLNENNVIDTVALNDHDDWGKILRDGPDGIGRNAYRDCGMGCARGEDLECLPGDFDGDGVVELLLRRGDRLVWASSTAGLELVAPVERIAMETIGPWELAAADSVQVGDFLGLRRDQLLLHKGREVALLDALGPAARVAWFEDDRIAEAGIEPTASWALGPADRFLAVRFFASERSDLAVVGGGNIAVFSREPGEPERLVLRWSAGEALHSWTRGETPTLRRGRTLASGEQTLLVSSATTLTELAASGGQPAVARLDLDGWIPALEPGGPTWTLATQDRFCCVDLDGDGTDELILLGQERLGVVLWKENGEARLAWMASGTIDGTYTLSPENEQDRVDPCQLVAGGGKELLLASGRSLAVLAWRAESRTLEIVDAPSGQVPGALDSLAWSLAPGQRLLFGRFLPGEGQTVLVQGTTSWGLLRLEAEGLRCVQQVVSLLGQWLLAPEDSLLPVNLDQDAELELVVRNKDTFGIVDFAAGPRLTFIESLDLDELVFNGIPTFRRGDVNQDGEVDISDVVRVLGYLFLGFAPPACFDAADADDDASITVSDPIRILFFLFSGGPTLPHPGPQVPGIDPTPDFLTCAPNG